MKIIDRVRQAIIGINLQGERHAEAQDIRTGGLRLAAIARKPGRLLETVRGLTETAEFHAAEAATWLTTTEIEAGAAGPFDACDLTAWLAIAAKAGVAVVPALPILHLSESEAEAAGGLVAMPVGSVPNRIRKHIAQAVSANQDEFEHLAAREEGAPTDREELTEKLYACMDAIPEGWMVRTTQCGGSELKSLAGTGLAGTTAPQVKFGPELAIGPGWIRDGNRRRVNTQDRRTIQAHASGPHRGMTFLARPWVEAARYVEVSDPHRHGSPFEGPGRWPMEWRAFIKGGRCIGVSVYYAWAGSASPENARIALEVRDLAQRLVDAAIAQGLEPRLMDLEHGRRNPEIAAMLDARGFGSGTFACTLDFIETQDGLMLLEGGPGHTPLGGGHPCGFAGTSGRPTMGNPMETIGVAFRPMHHVLVGEPSTWAAGDREGCILTWEQVDELARKE